ncbi:extracellular solute-binding protein [Thermosipho africanus H17ap60334]|nr:extracellular solute-binding protein [Thermosipho africanus]EKF49171.1 extracellular solute-binding protein [Thermosipho africanus H17ap60334]
MNKISVLFGFLMIFFAILAFSETVVTVGVFSWDVPIFQQIAEEFEKENPDIKIEIVEIPWTPGDIINSLLTAKAASGEKFPDVIAQSWEPIVYPVSQGWVYPLDEFIKNDPDYNYVPESIQNAFKFLGKTYALGERLHFNTIVLNLDLLEKLNLPVPSYDWDINTFMYLARRATNREYSGIDNLWEFDAYMAAVFSDRTTFWSFDFNKKRFDLINGGWLKAVEIQEKLRKIPGLDASMLFNQQLRDQGELDDYQKKFGEDTDAFFEGKILMGFKGTWDWDEEGLKSLPWKMDMYPLPHDHEIGMRQPIHINYAFMTSTTKHPKEAFKFLKYITYDPKGVVVKFKYVTSVTDAIGNSFWFVPATMHPEVVKEFKEAKFIPNGVKYMLENLDKTVQVDMWKVIPGWFQAINDVMIPTEEKIRSGDAEPTAIAAETEEKLNEIIEQAWNEFIKQVEEVQKNFSKLRKK